MESTFHTKVRLRCDNEPAAVIIAERVKALLPGVVVLESTPRHDHAANPAERAIRSVEDHVRVLRLDIESRYGISLNANMSFWPWIARCRSAFVRNSKGVQDNLWPSWSTSLRKRCET